MNTPPPHARHNQRDTFPPTGTAMDQAVADELDDFVSRRIAEGGAPTDF